MMEMPRDVNGNIVAPKSQHRIIPVEELRSNYAILQSKRTACELQHWCISLGKRLKKLSSRFKTIL
jgi:hypothetical protein